MNVNKQENIKQIKKVMGWAYPHIRKLSSEKLEQINKIRDGLLKECENKGAKYYSKNKSKIYSYDMSPGCKICAEGTWSCLFFANSCTRNCFFCPHLMTKVPNKSEPCQTYNIKFHSPKDYADYLTKFNFKGVGFSGGEPFLVFDKLLNYIEEIRRRIGKDTYLWAYTNGDLATTDNLKKLKSAGLNELRFNLAARNYNLKPLKSAVKYIDTVTIEIPAIPEDFDRVKKYFKKFNSIGVKYLNIHQLSATPDNYNAFVKRNYTFLHSPPYGILESELTALKLLKYSLENGLNLPVNYCTICYKSRFQSKGMRERLNPSIMDPFESRTDTGFIRNLSIKGSSSVINNIIAILEKKRIDTRLWRSASDNKTIFIHPSVFEYLGKNTYDLNISYLSFLILPEEKIAKTDYKKIDLNTNKSVLIQKRPISHEITLNPSAFDIFLKLFIKGFSEEEVYDYFVKEYGWNKNDLKELRASINKIKNKFLNFEFYQKGFPVIY